MKEEKFETFPFTYWNKEVNEGYYENDEVMAEFGRGIIDQYVGWCRKYGEPTGLRGWANSVQGRIGAYLLDPEPEEDEEGDDDDAICSEPE